jgi:hypothetical protein
MPGGALAAQRAVRLRPDLAVDFDGGWEACGDEQIRSLLLDHAPEQILHQTYRLFAVHGGSC